MEPITHFMTGACLARAGFNRKAAYATLAMTLAAEAPDLDILWSADGPVASFQHHRGITHTLVGLPFEGLIVLGAVWLIHRYRLRRASKAQPPPADPSSPTDRPIVRPLTAAPLRWGRLYGFVLIALLSHILLDWTNNYGVRPFFPFNPRWYAGSIVFIFEPVLFATLLLALVAPALFGLVGSEVGAPRPVFRGRGWAIFALVAMVSLWGWRAVEHSTAIRIASNAAYGPVELPASTSAPQLPVAPILVLRVTASPYPGNPFLWHTVAETPAFYQAATVDSSAQTLATNPEQDLFYKPRATPAIRAAKQSWLGRAYLDWSSWPLVTDLGPASSDGLPNPLDSSPLPSGSTAVSFHDLRFMYDTALIRGRTDPPLSGMVYIGPDGQVVRMQLGARIQR